MEELDEKELEWLAQSEFPEEDEFEPPEDLDEFEGQQGILKEAIGGSFSKMLALERNALTTGQDCQCACYRAIGRRTEFAV
jgi:hypothetical protein